VGFSIDLVRVALACGYKKAFSVSTMDAIKHLMIDLYKEQGPIFIEIRVKKGARPNLGRPKCSPVENRDMFMAYLHSDEKLK
jgi:phosphonopyruvate decarboxylase